MIVSPCKSGNIDPVVYSLLRGVDSKLPIVPITRLENYEFNPALLNIGRYVLVDFCEYDWVWDMETTHIFGKNTEKFKDKFIGEQWGRFDNFVKENPPVLYFKRELVSKDATETLLPIEYPCWHKVPEPQTKEQFNKRTLDVFYAWGLSHEERKRLHGEVWVYSGRYGYIVCDNILTLDNFIKHEQNPQKWLTVNVPWYSRYEIETILNINGRSKISVSLAGAGRKCFRHTESTNNSIMYMWDDNIKWTYDWVNNQNCIKSEEGKEIETIINALGNPDLYDIYRNGVATCEKYYLPNYINNYLLPKINSI
jgi:hypothetical protein